MVFYNVAYLEIPFFLPLGFIGLYRWIFWIIKIACWLLYRYVPNLHATIVVPTIDSGPEIKRAIKSWLVGDPFEIIFVTIPSAKSALEALARSADPEANKIRVITIEKGNKRNQMVAGINQVQTPICVLADDDVIWPARFLPYVLAPFEDSKMGGVGTSQRVLPLNKRFSVWEILASFRLSLRNVEISASTFIDGGVTCLSGRTAAYRTEILRDPRFQLEFTHEMWREKYHLHSGDDKFLTRWMQNNDWKTHIQTGPHTTLLSTFKDDATFLNQLMRWTRNSWRSDIKALIFERKIWKRHPWTAFTMLDRFFNPLTLWFGPISVGIIIYFQFFRNNGIPIWVFFVSYLIFLLATRFIKIDIFSVPIMLLFNFYFALLKVYCLFTLHVTAWGTRKGSDDSKNKEDSSIFQVYFPKIRDVSEQEINAIREKDDEQFKLFVKQNPPSITIVEPITVVSSTNNSPAMTPSSSLSSAITLGSSPVLPSPLGTTTTAALTAPSMAIEMESSNSSPKNSAPASSPQTGNYSRSPLSKTSYLANSGKNEMSLVNQKSSRPQTLLKPPHAESSNVLKPRPVAQQEAIKDRRTMSQVLSTIVQIPRRAPPPTPNQQLKQVDVMWDKLENQMQGNKDL